MKRYTQKQLRNLVATGAAINVADSSKKVHEPVRNIGYSRGVYGCNGLLMRGDSGQLYAIVSRSSALFFYL